MSVALEQIDRDVQLSAMAICQYRAPAVDFGYEFWVFSIVSTVMFHLVLAFQILQPFFVHYYHHIRRIELRSLAVVAVAAVADHIVVAVAVADHIVVVVADHMAVADIVGHKFYLHWVHFDLELIQLVVEIAEKFAVILKTDKIKLELVPIFAVC